MYFSSINPSISYGETQQNQAESKSSTKNSLSKQAKSTIQHRNIRASDDLSIIKTSPPKPLISENINALDLATYDTFSEKMVSKVRQYLNSCDAIGVAFTQLTFAGDKRGDFYTLGDSAVSIQIVRQLIRLGLEKPITLYINNENPLTLSQLAVLFPHCRFEGEAPWEVMFEGKRIVVKKPEKTEKVDLLFSFSSDSFELGLAKKAHISVKPFKFATPEVWYKPGTCCALQSSYPAASIIPQYTDELTANPLYSNQLTANYSYKKLRHLLDNSQLSEDINQDVLAKNLLCLSAKLNQKKIDFGIIYGLHHNDISDPQSLLSRWIDANQLVANDSQVPVLLAIKPGGKHFTAASLPPQTHILHITDAEFKKKLSNLDSNSVTLLQLPSLPTPVFRWLAASTNLPCLTEGANFTSDLLEQGKPYLSVLPYGKTPIPTDLGNPLEAIKHRTMSFKLCSNHSTEEKNKLAELQALAESERYIELMEKLQKLIEKGQYFVSGIPIKSNIPLYTLGTKYLYRKKIVTEKPGFNLLKFIENLANSKKTSDNLSARSIYKDFLSTVFAPESPQQLASYIHSCQDANSHTARHFEQASNSLEKPFYHNLVTAVYNAGIARKEILPVQISPKPKKIRSSRILSFVKRHLPFAKHKT